MKQWMLTLIMMFLLPTYAYAASHGDHDQMSNDSMQEKAMQTCQMKHKDNHKKQEKCINTHKHHDGKAMMKDKKAHSDKKMMEYKQGMKDKLHHNKMTASGKMTEKDKHSVNVNKASAKELAALPGISMKKANAIVEYRTKNGMFKNSESLMKVPGFGDKSVMKIKDHLVY